MRTIHYFPARTLCASVFVFANEGVVVAVILQVRRRGKPQAIWDFRFVMRTANKTSGEDKATGKTLGSVK
jgi:hypothetical protein